MDKISDTANSNENTEITRYLLIQDLVLEFDAELCKRTVDRFGYNM